MNRVQFAELAVTDGSTLEISPFTAPIMVGDRVKYADIMDTEALRQRAVQIGLDPATVVDVDFLVSPGGGDLGPISGFDVIVSSHVLEHQPNLLSHLNSVAHALSDEGRYFLILPDKRYCFDYFIPESSIADVLQANLSKNKQHTLKSVIEHLALTTHNDPARHWAGDHGSNTENLQNRIEAAMSAYQNPGSNYIDVHAWQFTPESFSAIVQLSQELELQPFVVSQIFPTARDNLEFFAILQKATNHGQLASNR